MAPPPIVECVAFGDIEYLRIVVPGARYHVRTDAIVHFSEAYGDTTIFINEMSQCITVGVASALVEAALSGTRKRRR